MKKILIWVLLAVMLFCSLISVFAADFKYGDITCDGSVNSKDAVLLAQYLAQWKVNISEEGLAAADVRKDGVINSKDAVLLAQHLARWNVQLGDGSTPSTKPDTGEAGTGDIEVPADDIIY